MPMTPLPVGESKSATVAKPILRSLGGLDDGGGQRMLAAALDAGREAPAPCFIETGAGTMRDHFRLAFGQRAGLVDDQRVDLFDPLQRLGIPDQNAFLAPRPTPTMIDIGVARPSAQGQAMISTLTAATSA